MVERAKSSKLIFFLILMLVSIYIYANDFKIIKNPKPNLFESNYVQLKKVKVINPDLGKGEYLFRPFSLTIDPEGCLYVYDNLQAKIFKFDKNNKFINSFGRVGQGPGEFSGTGIAAPVYIKIGRDRKLYANDIRTGKIIVFDIDGNYIKNIKLSEGYCIDPVVDSSGNIYFISTNENSIGIKKLHGPQIFTYNFQNSGFKYLYFQPYKIKKVFEIPKKTIWFGITSQSDLLVYFTSSSTFFQLQDMGLVRKSNLWPKEALLCYKKDLRYLRRKNKVIFKNIFFNPFIDDNNNLFYLQFGENREKGINALYEFDLRGDLLKVFYLKYKRPMPFTRFEIKKGNIFYGIQDNKLFIFKEG